MYAHFRKAGDGSADRLVYRVVSPPLKGLAVVLVLSGALLIGTWAGPAYETPLRGGRPGWLIPPDKTVPTMLALLGCGVLGCALGLLLLLYRVEVAFDRTGKTLTVRQGLPGLTGAARHDCRHFDRVAVTRRVGGPRKVVSYPVRLCAPRGNPLPLGGPFVPASLEEAQAVAREVAGFLGVAVEDWSGAASGRPDLRG